MGTEIISPVGRFVQGSISLEKKLDPVTNKPKTNEDGSEVEECYIGLAIRKDDPGLPAFYGAIVAQARQDFPHLFDASGNCLHPHFAWKVQDGDGRDSNGKSVADKPGFAGHYIFKLGTRFLPKCFHAGKYDPSQQILNPKEVIKRGYYIRVNMVVAGNGVKPNETQKKPGMFLSPNLVELVGFGEEIQSGPDASKVFGAAAPAQLPPGASATPVAPAGATVGLPGLPTLPGAAPAIATLPGAAPAIATLPGMPALPAPPIAATLPAPPVAAPVFTMTAKAMGATREQLHGAGWTDDLLIQHGYMTKT